jgi:putative DNA primase/helicase
MDNIKLERSVLACVLLSNRAWGQVSVLRERDFSLKAHRIMFQRMRTMAEAGIPIDELTLVEELSRHGELELVGHSSYITSLTDDAVARKDISDLVKTIRENATRRTAAKTGEALQRLAEDGTVSITALVEVATDFAGQCAQPSDALPPRFSEEALALRFSRLYADELRYVAAWGRWLYWDKKRWREDATLAVYDRARGICRQASAECTHDEKTIAVRLAASATVAAVERLARADRRHAAVVDQWDADPWLLNTPDGTVDLRRGELREHCREQYLTKLTAAGPRGKGNLWLSFLERVTNGDSELRAFLQRVIGYCVTGITREHALFFCYGTGANGKSVFLSTIAGVLGDYAKTAPASAFTASNTEQHPTDLAGLRGARFVTAIETEDGRWWAEAKIKSLTGGDSIAARFMRQDFFEYVPQFKLVVAGNHKPGLRNVDEAIRRRLHLIPFTVTIAEGERDLELAEKLKPEYPGILQWAIEGCLAWQREGLNSPNVVRNATSEYLAAEDAIGRWIEDRCVTGRQLWTAGAVLFSDWQQWCEQSGERPGSRKRLSQALEAQGFIQERTGANSTRGFAGIALRN